MNSIIMFQDQIHKAGVLALEIFSDTRVGTYLIYFPAPGSLLVKVVTPAPRALYGNIPLDWR